MITPGLDSSASKKTFYGLHTDQKPTQDIPNASTFYEMDTGALFMFDAENGLWLEQ